MMLPASPSPHNENILVKSSVKNVDLVETIGIIGRITSFGWHRQLNRTVTRVELFVRDETTTSSPLRRHHFPAEVISHAVWLYFRFPLSLRMLEEMLAESRSAMRRYANGR